MEKVYLAAMYGRREEMVLIADYLKTLGYEITARWVYGAEEASGISHEEISVIDLDDVDKADTIISFTHERGTMLPAGGGRHVEFGYALAQGKHMVIIGPKENVFHSSPGVEVYPSIMDWVMHEEDLYGVEEAINEDIPF